MDASSRPGRLPPAFHDLVAAHQQRVYYLALDLTGNHHDAEDLAQEVFIKAFRAMDRFRGDAQVSTWLYRIAVNTYLNKRRKKALAFMRLRDDFADTTFAQDTAPSPDARAEAGAVQRHLKEALRGLSPRERSAFVLRHYRELPVKEVAAAMDVAEGTVKSLLFRAVRKLRKALACYRDELGLAEG